MPGDTARTRTGLVVPLDADDIRLGAGQLRTAFDLIETLMPLDSQGTSALAGTGKRGEWYYRTSTGELFRSTGSAWVNVGTMISDGSVTDAKLASPNNSTYKTLVRVPFTVQGSTPVGKYWAPSGALLASGTVVTATQVGPGLIRVKASEIAVAGKTTKLRCGVIVAINATALGSSVVKVAAYPVTVAGGSTGELSLTLGTVKSDTEVTLDASWSQGVADRFTSDVDILSDATYALGVAVSSANVPSGTVIAGEFVVQYRNV